MAAKDDITKVFDELADIVDLSEAAFQLLPDDVRQHPFFLINNFLIKQYRELLDKADSMGFLS